MPVGELMEALRGQLNDRKARYARELCVRVETVLAGLARNYDPGTAESARLETEGLLARHGLTDERFAALGLDAKLAAEAVLANAHFSPSERIEVEPLCRRLLVSFYDSLHRDPALLAELLPHVYRETLRRLRHIEGGIFDIKRDVSDLGVGIEELLRLLISHAYTRHQAA